ncbi:hypothetical protein [uncultured Pseudoteredinibacter sp.]|uniref:hypothetical protein n=1 Tax=uncultured Pseudoteredinibacter sp. TaxID=1641701 RepID=UPI002601C057|nr:hypothetical protein [uncultured Pseudoteredinibacter sp.]
MSNTVGSWALAAELEKDIDIMAGYVVNDQSCLTLRRSYIRAVLSALEGVLYTLREDIIRHGDLGSFSPKQRAKLLEKVYRNGVVQSADKYLPLEEAIKFMPKCFARHMGIKGFEFPHGDEGWARMKEAIRIRNKITHPKCLNDLNVSVADLATVATAKVWFKERVSSQLIVP